MSRQGAVPSVEVMTTAEASRELLGDIRRLMDEAFEGDFTDDDWDHTCGGWHAVVIDGREVASHAAVVGRTLHLAGRPIRAGYVEGVATSPRQRAMGFGSLAATEIAAVIRHRFEVGALSTGAHRFYERLGWERWQGPTFARTGSVVTRTEEDDDTIMALRFDAGATIDLTASLSCEARSGDDW
ncbi:aminoglycoside N-acetyltransferase AAC(2')-Ic [soil metagenome]